MEDINGMTILIMKVIKMMKILGNWDKDRMNGKGLYVSPDGV